MQLDPRIQVGGLDGPQPVAVRQHRVRELAQLAKVIRERAGGGLDVVAVRTEERESLLVRRQRRHAQLVLVGLSLEPLEQLLVERAAAMPRMDLVSEVGRAPDPRPGHRLAVVLPDSEPPLALPSGVLEALPGDVGDVILHKRPLEPPQLADERLHATGLREGIGHPASCANARSNTSRGCAPRISRRPSSAKAGIPVMPIDCASAVDARTRSR